MLGLVGHLGEATSYQLKQLVGSTIGGFWPVPHSQLYAEPARLAGLGLLHERREPAGRKKRTYRLTDEGRRRFLEYITVLEDVVADALAASTPAPAPSAGSLLAEGWSPA